MSKPCSGMRLQERQTFLNDVRQRLRRRQYAKSWQTAAGYLFRIVVPTTRIQISWRSCCNRLDLLKFPDDWGYSWILASDLAIVGSGLSWPGWQIINLRFCSLGPASLLQSSSQMRNCRTLSKLIRRNGSMSCGSISLKP